MATQGADVIIVGQGLVGSVAARCLAEAGADVLIVEAGTALSAEPGEHLRNTTAVGQDPFFQRDVSAACLRPVSVPAPSGGRRLAAGWDTVAVALGRNPLQERDRNMVGARHANVHGGMGVLWNGITPRLVPGVEGSEDDVSMPSARCYRRAEELLGIHTGHTSTTERMTSVMAALEAGSGLRAQVAPVAVRPAGPGVPGVYPRWTGPAEILGGAPPEQRRRIRVLAQHSVLSLDHDGSRVRHARVVDLTTGTEKHIGADVFFLAAGPLRNPALLWASDLGDARAESTAVGRYLYDHPLVYAQVAWSTPADEGRSPTSRTADAVMIPPCPDRPIHTVLQFDAADPILYEQHIDESRILSIYSYWLMEQRRENRVLFDGRTLDAYGLPAVRFDYRLSAEDERRRTEALADLGRLVRALGESPPGRTPQHLSPGSSMHLLGTTRMGRKDDGESVADDVGRVWGLANLFLGGSSLFAHPTASNPVLTACALSVRSVDVISRKGEAIE